MNRAVLVVAISTMLVCISGCKKANPEQASTMDTPAQQAQPHGWLLTSAPQGAVSVTEARSIGKEGDAIVIRGRIGGRHTPMSADSPVFTVVDLELPYCGQHEDDGCATPWDYCCEMPRTISTNSATVQIVGDGTVDPVAAGLEPLDIVVLVGTVGPRPTDEIFTIQSTGVYQTTDE